MPQTDRNIALGAGRAVLAALFALAGLNKLLNPQMTLGLLVDAGMQPAWPLLLATAGFELAAAAALVFGRRPGAIAAILLAVFTLATNLLFHRFWLLDGVMARLELSLFFKNIAIMGGLFYVALIEWRRDRH